jgi:hypothetical protein
LLLFISVNKPIEISMKLTFGVYQAKKDLTIFGGFSAMEVSTGQIIAINGYDFEEGYNIEVGPLKTMKTHEDDFIKYFDFIK